MQSGEHVDDLRLSFYVKDPGSGAGPDCPSVHSTNHGTWVFTGVLRNEPEVRAQLVAPKPHETPVEISDQLAELFVITYARERYGIDLGGAAS